MIRVGGGVRSRVKVDGACSERQRSINSTRRPTSTSITQGVRGNFVKFRHERAHLGFADRRDAWRRRHRVSRRC